MKKILIVMFVMFGMTVATYAQSPIISLGKAIGELAVAPVGIAVGVVEGVADGVCESVTYLVTGETSTKTVVKTTTVTQTTAPVYVVPSQPKPKEQRVVNINNSENVSVTINEVNTTATTKTTPTVIYVPSTRPSYYYYRPWGY